MKILIMSDSHGLSHVCVTVAEKESPDIIVHLGDNQKDTIKLSQQFPDIPLYSVRGNCDLRSESPDEIEFETIGVRFYMTHGHLHDVKRDIRHLISAAKQKGSDVVLFGHTHIAYHQRNEGIVFLNPGSLLKTYAILELKDGATVCDIKNAWE